MTIKLLNSKNAHKVAVSFKPKGIILSALNLFMMGFLRKNRGFTSVAHFWCDGIMAKKYIRAKGYEIERIHGVELLRKMLKLLNGKNIDVIGSIDENSKNILLRSGITIESHIPLPNFDPMVSDIGRIKINSHYVLILLPSPKQELLAWELIKDPKNVHANFYCLGGALEMLSNPDLYCPPWMQKIGLEFLFRLKTDTWRRLRRLARSAIDFLFNVKFLYGEIIEIIEHDAKKNNI